MEKAGLILFSFFVLLGGIRAMDDRDNHADFEEGVNVRFIPDRYDEGQIIRMRRLMHELLQRAQRGELRGQVDMENDVEWQHAAAALDHALWQGVARGDDSDE